MHRRIFLTAAASTAMAIAPIAHAAVPLGDYLSLSGFGTLGAVRTNSDEAQYVRDLQISGAGKRPTLKVDSDFGLQLNAKANDWLSGTVQALTEERETDKMSTRVEWAFVKVIPVDGLAVRVGKMNLPTFLVSDSRRVNYVNTWLRPPNEVYGLDVLDGGLTGADVSYRVPVAGQALVVTGLRGSSSISGGSQGKVKSKDVTGGNLLWDGDWYTLRVGYLTTKPQFSPELGAALGVDVSNLSYKFTGFGFSVDRNNFLLQGEYVERRLTKLNSYVGGNAWYLFGGYRIDKFVPFASFADLKPVKDGLLQPQKTVALGLRWDAFSAADVKFQVERVDTKGGFGASLYPRIVMTPDGPAYGPVTRPVMTFSVAVDFAF